MDPVIIVGGGLAGLAAAHQLHEKQISFLLYEQSDRLGGRLKTDEIDGFRLDHGFQVLFDAYPYVQRLINLGPLDLHKFPAGAQIWDGTRFRLVDQRKAVHMATTRFFSLADKLRTLRLLFECRFGRPAWPDETAEDYLRRLGFSDAFLTQFARPFFGGVFLDRSLGVSAEQFRFVFRMLSTGAVCLPAQGISSVPNALVANLPQESLRINSGVGGLVTQDEVVTGVQLKDGHEVPSSRVILAVEPPALAQFGIGPTPVGHLSSFCAYFETPTPVCSHAYLMLNMNSEGLVNQVAPVSNVAPTYAPKGRHLISVTVLGDRAQTEGQLVAAMRAELTPWFPDQRTSDWRFIRSYRIPYAQMPQPPGYQLNHPKSPLKNLSIAGEAMTNSSIDGALESGFLAAGGQR